MNELENDENIFEPEPEALPPVAPEIQAYLNASKEMLQEAFDRIPSSPSYSPLVFPAPPELEFHCDTFCLNKNTALIALQDLLNSGWRLSQSIPRPCGTDFQVSFIFCREKESKPDA